MKLFQFYGRLIGAMLLVLPVFIFCRCTRQESVDNQPETLAGQRTGGSLPFGKSITADTIQLKTRSWAEIVCAKEKIRIRKVLGHFETNYPADSVCWELAAASPGILLEPGRGKGDQCTVNFIRESENTTGEIIIRATPWKSGLVSKPAEFKFLVEKCDGPGPGIPVLALHGHPVPVRSACFGDTAGINCKRRKIITEFSELLFMYGRTSSITEKEYFKTDAEKKLKEIPNFKVDIFPDNDLQSVFNESVIMNPRLVPLYDDHSGYIVGIRVVKKPD